MPQSFNESLVRRFYLDLWNQWNLAVADEILAVDLRFRGTLGASDIDIDAFKRYFVQARESFPDLHADIHELIAAGDAVVGRVFGVCEFSLPTSNTKRHLTTPRD